MTQQFQKIGALSVEICDGCFCLGPCSGPKAHVFLLGQVFSNNSELELLSRRAILKSNDCVGACEFVYTNTYLPTYLPAYVRMCDYVCTFVHVAMKPVFVSFDASNLFVAPFLPCPVSLFK